MNMRARAGTGEGDSVEESPVANKTGITTKKKQLVGNKK